MLQVIGHIYSDTQEKFNELVDALIAEGFQVAYDSTTNATIIREVEDEQFTNQKA